MDERLVFVAGHVAIDDEQHGVGLAGDVGGEFGAALPADFVDAGGVDEVDAAAVDGLPQGVFAVPRFAVQDAGGEDFFARERVQQCRFADADAAIGGDVNVALFEFVEQALQLAVVFAEARLGLVGQAFVVKQGDDAVARFFQVRFGFARTARGDGFLVRFSFGGFFRGC